MKHAWAPKQAPALVGTRASTPMPLLHLPGPRTPNIALDAASHAYGSCTRVLGTLAKRYRACAPTRTCVHPKRRAARTRFLSLLPTLHIQRASAVNFGRTKDFFGRGEPPRATLQEQRGSADRRATLSSSREKLPETRIQTLF